MIETTAGTVATVNIVTHYHCKTISCIINFMIEWNIIELCNDTFCLMKVT